MQIDTNYEHKVFTVYSGYRPTQELNPEQFSVELTQPLLDVKQLSLDYVQFNNNIVPLKGLTFSWSEAGYGGLITTFNFPDYFLDPPQLMAYIQQQMNLLSPNALVYTVVLDATTGKITWDSTGPFTLYFGGITTSGYNLGMNQVADGRIIYPGVPANYTPIGNTFTSTYPIDNREIGIAIHIRPFSTDSCSNDIYLDTHQFIVPLGGSNYGGIVNFYRSATFHQNIAFFKPGHSFKRLYFSVVRWVDTYNRITPGIMLNSEIIMRFSYATYRDSEIMVRSLTLKEPNN